jgi:hypothetical protein
VELWWNDTMWIGYIYVVDVTQCYPPPLLPMSPFFFRIQVPSKTTDILGDFFDFEGRGSIQVKGKGEMKVSLLVKKKEGTHWE